MSETSKQYKISNKRRINEIDDTIEYLSHEVKKLNDFVFKADLESSLMTAKLKREKVKALTAVAKSQVILADMEILIAESDLYSDLIRMKNRKKLKLACDEGKTGQYSSGPTQNKPETTIKCKITKSTHVQTTETMHNQKKKKKSSTKPKCPVDTSSDETVIVESLPVSISLPVIESVQSGFTEGSLNNQPKTTSDSEISLSGSIKAEFNNPYTTSDAVVSETSTQKRSDKKIDPKGKSSHHKSPSISTKTVAEINKTVLTTPLNKSKENISSLVTTPKHSKQKIRIAPYEKKLTASTSTYVPIRHNLPMIVTQPRNTNVSLPYTATISPSLYVNTAVTQGYLYQSPSMSNPSLYVNPAVTKSHLHQSPCTSTQSFAYYAHKQ